MNERTKQNLIDAGYDSDFISRFESYVTQKRVKGSLPNTDVSCLTRYTQKRITSAALTIWCI